jgi:5-methylthioadenosine/S-adenosylhomocysteine deaminase
MLPRLASKDYRTWPSTAEVLGRSIRAGAKALGLGGDLGALAPGQIADLVLLDMEGAMSVGLKLNAELVAQHGNRDLVTDVMVDGNWVMRKGELLTIDERGVLADFQEHREEFIARAVKQSDKLNRTEKFFRRKLLD